MGTVNVAHAPEYLEYTSTIKPMGDAISTVRWTLDTVDGGTRLSLDHESLPQSAEAFGLLMALDNGWDGHLGNLRTTLDSAET
jgi:hypothetical protein